MQSGLCKRSTLPAGRRADCEHSRRSEPLNMWIGLGFTQQPGSPRVIAKDEPLFAEWLCSHISLSPALLVCGRCLPSSLGVLGCRNYQGITQAVLMGCQSTTKGGLLAPVILARYLLLILKRKGICTLMCRLEIVYWIVNFRKNK